MQGTPPDPFETFLAFVEGILTPLGLQDFAVYVALIPFLLLLYILYLISVRATKASFRKVGMPREAASGIIFIIRLVFFGVAVATLITVTNVVVRETALTAAALIGTAVGLAFSKALSNLVSGLYVFSARPFRVGNYVGIRNDEGLVTEITLNYTRLLLPDYTRQFVPNSKVIESQVTNFRVRVDDYLAERGIEYHAEYGTQGKLDAALDRIRYLTRGDEIFRHKFIVQVHKDYDIDEVTALFLKLCSKWKETFLEKPEFTYLDNSNFGVIYAFTYIVRDPKQILDQGSAFQTEVAESLMNLK